MKNASKLIMAAFAALMMFSVVAAPAMARDHHDRHDNNHRWDNRDNNRRWDNNRGNNNNNWNRGGFRRNHAGMSPAEVRDMRWNRHH
jgi:hypothetical protein